LLVREARCTWWAEARFGRGFISLGYDHRLVNGADGDQFRARIKRFMENFPDEA
jgi:hypothetical protein